MREIGAPGSDAQDVRFSARSGALADIARGRQATFAKSHDCTRHSAP
jgi:hypothetical protein